MKRQLINVFTSAGLMLVAFVGDARAQENLPLGPSNYEHDFQFFEPLELDLDNMPSSHPSGYSFEYNKLFWSYSGERVTVGDANTTEFAEVIFRDNAQDEGTVPAPYQIRNTMNDVPPKAGFAFGNRYELGYRDRDNGWTLGILDGPELNQTEVYGFVPRADGGIPPFIHPDYTDGSDIGPGGGPVAGFDVRAFGFGSVPILFETPPGYLDGFRDYTNLLADGILGTQGGPLLYVGNYGATDEVTLDDDGIPVFRVADDIDGDGIAGSDIIVVILPDGTVAFAVVKDFDDLHRFNIFFDSVNIRNTTETDGVELMWSHALTKQHYQAKHQNNEVTVSFGARFLRLYDEFRVDAFGSILHDAFWDTSFINQIVGPQVGLRWTNQRQRWRLQTDGRFMFGYNVADWDQFGITAINSVPGALNQGLYERAHAFAHGTREQEFSPVAELRVQAAYHFTSGLALKAGYTGSFVGNIRRAAPSVRYRLPDMGYVDAGNQHLLINGLDIGLEFVH